MGMRTPARSRTKTNERAPRGASIERIRAFVRAAYPGGRVDVPPAVEDSWFERRGARLCARLCELPGVKLTWERPADPTIPRMPYRHVEDEEALECDPAQALRSYHVFFLTLTPHRGRVVWLTSCSDELEPIEVRGRAIAGVAIGVSLVAAMRHDPA